MPFAAFLRRKLMVSCLIDSSIPDLANKVAERYTEVERSQHITQTDTRVYGQSYVANTSSVAGKEAFLDEPAQHNHVDYFQSFAKFCEKGLPNSLPAGREALMRQDLQLLELESQAIRLNEENAAPSEIKSAKNKVRSYRTSLIKKSLKQYQVEWVRERRDWKITSRGKEQSKNYVKTDLFNVLSLIMPERGRLAKTMISAETVSDSERKQILEGLYSLISQDCSVLYLPGEKPNNGVCLAKNCNLEMAR